MTNDPRPYDYDRMCDTLCTHGEIDYALVYRALSAEGLRPWRATFGRGGIADGHDACLVIERGYNVRRT